jgi:hypothetical protein
VEGNINVTADGLDKNIVALSGSSFPKAETFDVACYNISFFVLILPIALHPERLQHK